MLRPDVPIAELVRDGDRLVENDSRSGGVGQIGNPGSSGRLSILNHVLDRCLDLGGIGAEVFQDIHHQGIIFGEEAEEEMLGSHVLVVASMRFLARLDQRATDPGGEIVSSQKTLPSWEVTFAVLAVTASC